MSSRSSGDHPFQRLGAEIAAVRALGGGPDHSIRELAALLEVDVEEIERTWRGLEPLSIKARRRLADLLRDQITALGALERALRQPVLEVEESGTALR